MDVALRSYVYSWTRNSMSFCVRTKNCVRACGNKTMRLIEGVKEKRFLRLSSFECSCCTFLLQDLLRIRRTLVTWQLKYSNGPGSKHMITHVICVCVLVRACHLITENGRGGHKCTNRAACSDERKRFPQKADRREEHVRFYLVPSAEMLLLNGFTSDSINRMGPNKLSSQMQKNT